LFNKGPEKYHISEDRKMKKMLFKSVLLLGLVFVTTPAIVFSDTNVALNKQITLNGIFFTGGWGNGQVVSPATIVDDYFFPASTQWDQGAVWWDASYGPQSIDIALGGFLAINSFIVQADDNDQYRISYYDLTNNLWSTAWDIPAPGGWGLQTSSNVLANPIVTNALRFEAIGGDGMYSVSEIQAYGEYPVPEPTTMLLLGLGLMGLAGVRRKFKN
jgi:hypothetical protein